MAEHATPAPNSHPLLEDRDRLERIKNNMHVQIQLVLHGRRISDDVELALSGGASVDDVLQDALIGLVRTDPAKVRNSWEALSCQIARNKAKDALSKATSGRRSRAAEPGTPDDVTLVPLDERLDEADNNPANDPAGGLRPRPTAAGDPPACPRDAERAGAVDLRVRLLRHADKSRRR